MMTGFPLSRKNLTDRDLYTYALVLNGRWPSDTAT